MAVAGDGIVNGDLGLGTAAPEGSSTVPSIVPALPSDWPNADAVKQREIRPRTATARILFIGFSIGIAAACLM